MDRQGRSLAALQRLCQQVVEVGRSLPLVKGGELLATGWDDRRFAVARNEAFEIGTRRLLPHTPRGERAHIPEALLATHGLVADELDGVIDLVTALEREV